MTNTDKSENYKKEYLESYRGYNQILRSWFVAFGIGGPIIFLTNDALYVDFLKLDDKGCIVALFFVGLFAQILVSFLNKIANWYIYSDEKWEPDMNEPPPGFWSCFIKHFWIDISADVLTVGAFGWATYLLFQGLAEI